MFDETIKNQYKFLTDYFSSILKTDKNRMPQSIIFYGQDINAQYKIAIELARLLNCKGDKNESCNCFSCDWIKNNNHPAVLTITNIDNKPSGDKTGNVISIKQAQMVKSSLNNTSDYYRVFIFCGANLINDVWTPKGLNFENFKKEAANALLKIVEETPQNTVFFFLANDLSDIISTIVSRSQTFFVPSFNKNDLTFSGIKEIFEDYPNFEPQKLFEYSNIFKKNLETYSNTFDKCQNYLLSVLKSNPNDNLLKQRVITDLKIFEKAKQMYKLEIKSETICDDIFLALMRK